MEDLHHLDWQISFKNRVKKSNIKKTLLRKSFDKCQKEIVFKFCFNLSKVRDHVKSVPKASRLPLSVIDLCFLNLIGWGGLQHEYHIWVKNLYSDYKRKTLKHCFLYQSILLFPLHRKRSFYLRKTSVNVNKFESNRQLCLYLLERPFVIILWSLGSHCQCHFRFS